VKKFLIFIVSFNAERHIASVFSRIPYGRLPEGTELLLPVKFSYNGNIGAFGLGRAPCLTAQNQAFFGPQLEKLGESQSGIGTGFGEVFQLWICKLEFCMPDNSWMQQAWAKFF
jgi:hypothetical protein